MAWNPLTDEPPFIDPRQVEIWAARGRDYEQMVRMAVEKLKADIVAAIAEREDSGARLH